MAKGDAPTYLPFGYKKRKKTTTELTRVGSVDHIEHFDGSVDATVKIKSLKLNLTSGSANRHHLDAIAELEAAQKEHMLAKHSGNEDWLGYTTSRIEAANVRLLEVQ